jgi:hypothetical protein
MAIAGTASHNALVPRRLGRESEDIEGAFILQELALAIAKVPCLAQSSVPIPKFARA